MREEIIIDTGFIQNGSHHDQVSMSAKMVLDGDVARCEFVCIIKDASGFVLSKDTGEYCINIGSGDCDIDKAKEQFKRDMDAIFESERARVFLRSNGDIY